MHSPATLVAILTLACAAPAQLSGVYTVDPKGSGSRNFISLRAASYALAVRGINGPVTVTVADGAYAERWDHAQIPGASATNRVTFRSKTKHGAAITTTREPAVFFQDWNNNRQLVRWITLDGFLFKRGPSSYAIYGYGSCSDIEIRNCRFDKVDVDLHGDHRMARFEIHHNHATSSQFRIRAVQAFDVHHNRFELSLMQLDGSGLGAPSRIWNNLFSGGAGRRYALLDTALGANTIVEHNTMMVTIATSLGACIRVGGQLGRPVVVKNNVFHTNGAGAAAEFETVLPYANVADGNVYWSVKGGNIVSDLATQNGARVFFRTLAAWQARSGVDKKSLQVDPLLNANLTVKTNSPAVGKAVNTSSFVKDDFAGTPRYSSSTIGAYEGFLPVKFTAFGKGCAGTGNYVPMISSAGDHWLGSKNFQIILSGARGGFGVRAVLAIGASNSVWGPVKLPLDLGGGCSLLVSPDLLFVLPVSGGTGAGRGAAAFSLNIPNDPKLVGVKIYFQWGVADPAAKGIGLAFSGAGELGT